MSLKRCNKCGSDYPATSEFFYVQRSRRKGKPDTWQAHCRSCWRKVNAENKLRIKLKDVL